MQKTVFPDKHTGNRCIKNRKAKASEAKTGFDCITEVHESTRQRIESVTKGFMKNTLQGKGRIPYCITI